MKTLDESQLQEIAESIDRLITVDMCMQHIPRGSMIPLYRAARKLVGKPLSLAAAEELRSACQEDRWVIISTGFVLKPYMPYGETDGPPGAVALARAINKAFKCKILLLAEEDCVEPLRAIMVGAGLLPVELDVALDVPQSITIMDFPMDVQRAKEEAARICEKFDPVAMITLEKCGRNEKGIYHTGPGGDMSAWTAKVDILFDMLRDNGILTIGIGDFGNEIGLGALKETIKEISPSARKCNCPCGAGNATMVEAKIPFVAAISNWGANGICACLAAMLGDHKILHDPETERRMVEQACLAGLCDGMTVKPTFSVDGVSVNGHVAMNILLHELLRSKTETVAFVRD
jgi:hypothetical protein